MKLKEFIAELQTLADGGHGDKEVFARHGSSGECHEVGSAHVTSDTDEDCGPFGLKEGEEYVSIYIGN